MNIGILNPCQFFEAGSFLWLWNLCWLPSVSVRLALVALLVAAGLAVVVRRRV